jgi:hypothetical protein
VNATLQTTPSDAKHWSVRTLAERQRGSQATVHRMWQAEDTRRRQCRLAGVASVRSNEGRREGVCGGP